jgi:transposase
VKRLETVPGVGPIVALTTIAVFAEVSRFESAKHAASYPGLVPSTFQSGERDAHGHITKRGSAELRAMLCLSASARTIPKRLPTHGEAILKLSSKYMPSPCIWWLPE